MLSHFSRFFGYFLTDKVEGTVPILPRGLHTFPFKFQLPESQLPCSFESKPGFIRYYIKVTVDIPYASPPQGMKYFTIIGPHIDCMDEQYLVRHLLINLSAVKLIVYFIYIFIYF